MNISGEGIPFREWWCCLFDKVSGVIRGVRINSSRVRFKFSASASQLIGATPALAIVTKVVADDANWGDVLRSTLESLVGRECRASAREACSNLTTSWAGAVIPQVYMVMEAGFVFAGRGEVLTVVDVDVKTVRATEPRLPPQNLPAQPRPGVSTSNMDHPPSPAKDFCNGKKP